MRDYWSYCGEIEDMDLMRFPDTGRFKGIAFITFADVRPCYTGPIVFARNRGPILSRIDAIQ